MIVRRYSRGMNDWLALPLVVLCFVLAGIVIMSLILGGFTLFNRLRRPLRLRRSPNPEATRAVSVIGTAERSESDGHGSQPDPDRSRRGPRLGRPHVDERRRSPDDRLHRPGSRRRRAADLDDVLVVLGR